MTNLTVHSPNGRSRSSRVKGPQRLLTAAGPATLPPFPVPNGLRPFGSGSFPGPCPSDAGLSVYRGAAPTPRRNPPSGQRRGRLAGSPVLSRLGGRSGTPNRTAYGSNTRPTQGTAWLRPESSFNAASILVSAAAQRHGSRDAGADSPPRAPCTRGASPDSSGRRGPCTPGQERTGTSLAPYLCVRRRRGNVVLGSWRRRSACPLSSPCNER